MQAASQRILVAVNRDDTEAAATIRVHRLSLMHAAVSCMVSLQVRSRHGRGTVEAQASGSKNCYQALRE